MSTQGSSREAATRHGPIAYGVEPRTSGVRNRQVRPEDASNARAVAAAKRRASETKLRAPVVGKTDGEADPYADVPCTD